MAKLCPHCSVDVADDAAACWRCHGAIAPGTAKDAPPRPVKPAAPPLSSPAAAAAPPPPDYKDIKLALTVEAVATVLGLALWKTHVMVLLGTPLFAAITLTLMLLVGRWAGGRAQRAGGGFLPALGFGLVMILALPLAAAIAFCCACIPMWGQMGGL